MKHKITILCIATTVGFLASSLLFAVSTNRGEESEKTTAARQLLLQRQIENDISMVEWKSTAFKLSVTMLVSTPCLSLVLIAGCYAAKILRESALVTQKIGQYSEISMHRKLAAMPEMIQLTAGMIQAEALRVENPERYVQFAAKVMKQIDLGKLANRPETQSPKALPGYTAPKFRDLLQRGEIADGKPLVFGYTQDGKPRTGSWLDAYSCGISGQSGFGKSSTMRYLMAQSLLTHVVDTFYIIDPHYPHRQSLLSGLGRLRDLPNLRYVDNAFDTRNLIKEINSMIDRRLADDEESFPLKIVVVDELMYALSKIPGLDKLMERVGCESRKTGVYGMFASQSWVGQKTGGTTARDNLTCLMAHRMQKVQARTFLQDKKLAEQCVSLKKGQIIFSPVAEEPQVLSVPYCREEDMEEVYLRVSNGGKTYANSAKNVAYTARHKDNKIDMVNDSRKGNAALETKCEGQTYKKKMLTLGMRQEDLARNAQVDEWKIKKWMSESQKTPKSMTEAELNRICAVLDGRVVSLNRTEPMN